VRAARVRREVFSLKWLEASGWVKEGERLTTTMEVHASLNGGVYVRFILVKPKCKRASKPEPVWEGVKIGKRQLQPVEDVHAQIGPENSCILMVVQNVEYHVHLDVGWGVDWVRYIICHVFWTWWCGCYVSERPKPHAGVRLRTCADVCGRERT